MEICQQKREQVIRDGYCLIENVLDQKILDRVRSLTDEVVSGLDKKHRQVQKSTGSMVGSDTLPEMVDLFVWPKAIATLESMGFRDNKFWSAYLINKPAHSPQLFWHQDCIMWEDPRAYSDRPPMLFLMYYLTDTNRQNGCLRVLPGTHRKRHPLHHIIPEAHTEAVRRMDDPDNPVYGLFDGEVEVPARAGDLVLGDARMFHASHANQSDRDRTVITIWYHPWFYDLAEPTQAWISQQGNKMHERWPQEARRKLEPVLGDYKGSQAPMRPLRIPGPGLV